MGKLLTQKNIHLGFHIGLIMKGVYDLGEILSGILLIFLTPDRMGKLITIISSGELREDPNDFIMRHLISFSKTFSINTQLTASLYLLSHGLVKILIIILLWKKKLWAYPASCVVFSIFVIIQMLNFIQTYSITMLFLTLIDIIMIILTILEYKNIRAE
jgi:uncharacterized membrane protein